MENSRKMEKGGGRTCEKQGKVLKFKRKGLVRGKTGKKTRKAEMM